MASKKRLGKRQKADGSAPSADDLRPSGRVRQISKSVRTQMANSKNRDWDVGEPC